MKGILRRSVTTFALSMSGVFGIVALSALAPGSQLACMKIRPYSSSAMTPAAIARSQSNVLAHTARAERTFVLWHFADGTFALRAPLDQPIGASSLLPF
jgi:hypothetical protein